MSLAAESSKAAATSSSKKSKKVTIAYNVCYPPKTCPQGLPIPIPNSILARFAWMSSEACSNILQFPRVTLFLDNRSLEPTPEFDQDLQNASSKEDMYALQDKYGKYHQCALASERATGLLTCRLAGEFFSSRVQLGGRLFATEDIDETSDTSSSEQVKSMKVAAAVSLSGWGVKVDVSGGYSPSAKVSKMAPYHIQI